MNHRVRQLGAFAFAATTLGFAAACDDDDEPTAPNVQQTTFNAALNGANERPNPVTTAATGTATVVLFDDDSAQFIVNVANIDSVISSHIHAGDASTAGSIMFGFPATNPPASFTAQTQLHSGTITRTSTFSGSFTFDSLITRLNAGTAYVNVHTRRNQAGEIRGQLLK